MAAIVKVQCDDGEIYRLTLQDKPTFESIIEVVATCRPELQASMMREGGCHPLKYADDEGDLCTLAPATFVDFLEQQGGESARILKLKLSLGKTHKTVSKDETPKVESDKPAAETPKVEETAQAPQMPCQGPPPGLGQDDASDFSWRQSNVCGGPGAWGPGGGGGGPKKLLYSLKALRDTGMLTPAMFSSLAVQWLPLVTQRVARKVDKINHMARDGLEPMVQTLLTQVKDLAAATPGLETHAEPVNEALSGGGSQRRLGESVLELLKALRGLGFEVQALFCEKLAEHLLPFLDEIIKGFQGDSCGGNSSGSTTAPAAWQHHFGFACDGCNANPIIGPRFRCPTCPDYDLCGNCYPRKLQLHKNCPSAQKDFQCIIFPGMGQSSKKHDKSEKCDGNDARGFDWTALGKDWAGKGAGKLGGFLASMAGHGLGGLGGCGGGFPFPPCAFPFPGMDHTFEEGPQDVDWSGCHWGSWGKKGNHGKGKGKGWKKGKGWHHPEQQPEDARQHLDPQPKEGSAEAEFERKISMLRELQLGSDEVLRDLLIAHDGDATRVARILCADH